jgi:hypothetical protein
MRKIKVGTAGMCAHGFSAGAGAAAYATAWYGAADQTTGYLDKLELLSGPELADVRQGCAINFSGGDPNYSLICQAGQNFGCSGWYAEDPPGYSLEFSSDAASAVEGWSGGTQVTGPACANNSTQTTYDQSWQHMSIVDLPAQNGLPSFNYPKTSISAWLCQTVTGAAQNNSESQAEIFYEQFTSGAQFGGNAYSVNAVSCVNNPEDVNDGTVVATGQNGFTAVWKDMSDPGIPNRCQKLTGH